jgi:hypothetical protein
LIAFAAVRAEQAAEKGLNFVRTPEKHSSGPKGPVAFAALTARLKSCPDTKHRFSAACEALTYQSCPFKTSTSSALSEIAMQEKKSKRRSFDSLPLRSGRSG